MSEEPQHDLIDFLALAAIPTNEQRILASLERTEAALAVQTAMAARLETLLERLVDASEWTPKTRKHVELIAAEEAKARLAAEAKAKAKK